MKYSKGSDVGNHDLPFQLLTNIEEVLPQLDAIVLNGIGEPLLHPDLSQIIEFCRERLRDNAWIGLQSNGALLTKEYAEMLMNKGLNRLCLSLDSAADSTASSQGHGVGHAEEILRAFANVRIARQLVKPENFELGVEIVLMRENIQELPELVERAGRLGAEFIIVSHLLAYKPEMESSCLFNPNTTEATELFNEFRAAAQSIGIELTPEIFPLWDNQRDPIARKLFPLYKAMSLQAKQLGITQHLPSLIEWMNKDTSVVEAAYAQANEVADNYNIRLDLPPLQASHERECPFVRNNACFITAQGEISPCHSLLHSYSCYMDGEEKTVSGKSFGTMSEMPLINIWESDDCQNWLEEVHSYGYPFCRSCALGPCADVTNQNYPFTNDCYGFSVPCGHCMWSLGALSCL